MLRGRKARASVVRARVARTGEKSFVRRNYVVGGMREGEEVTY